MKRISPTPTYYISEKSYITSHLYHITTQFNKLATLFIRIKKRHFATINQDQRTVFQCNDVFPKQGVKVCVQHDAGINWLGYPRRSNSLLFCLSLFPPLLYLLQQNASLCF